jgi:transcription elongation factor GreA
MFNSKQYLTKEKHRELKLELQSLKTEKRKEIAGSLEYAKSLGDLSENAEYHQARDAQAALEERIRHLEGVLQNAEIVSKNKTNVEVAVGSEVTVKKKGSQTKIVYTLVGSEEADTESGKISVSSPFGQAVMEKKKGEEFVFVTPGGENVYTVVAIK